MPESAVQDIHDQVGRLRRRTRWTVAGFLVFAAIGSGAANVDRGMLYRRLADVTDAYLIARDPGATGVIASLVADHGLFRPDGVSPIRDLNRVRRAGPATRPGQVASAADPVDVSNPVAAAPVTAEPALPQPVAVASQAIPESIVPPVVGPPASSVSVPLPPPVIGFPGIFAPVPEPATWLAMILGFLGLGAALRLRPAQRARVGLTAE